MNKLFLFFIPILFFACIPRPSESQEEEDDDVETFFEEILREMGEEDFANDPYLNPSPTGFEKYNEEEFEFVKNAMLDFQDDYIEWIEGYQVQYGDARSNSYVVNFKRCKKYMSDARSWEGLLHRLNDMDAMHLEFTELPKHKPVLYEKYDPGWEKTKRIQTRQYPMRTKYGLW